MHVARSLLVLGSAAVMLAGSMLLAIGSTVTTAAAPGRAIAPASHRPASHLPASHLPASHLPASHLPASDLPTGFLAAARSSLVRYLRDDHPQVELVRRGRLDSRPGGASQAASYNWSGYADFSATRVTFTQVSGQWTTPRATCGSEDTITSQWVGIDGWSDQTAEQDGTLDWCFKGSATYFTWYEMYPAGPVAVGTSLQCFAGERLYGVANRHGICPWQQGPNTLASLSATLLAGSQRLLIRGAREDAHQACAGCSWHATRFACTMLERGMSLS